MLINASLFTNTCTKHHYTHIEETLKRCILYVYTLYVTPRSSLQLLGHTHQVYSHTFFRYKISRFEKKMQHQGKASGHKSVFKSTLPQFQQFKVVDAQQKTRERNIMSFQRNKTRLDRIMADSVAYQRRIIKHPSPPRK